MINFDNNEGWKNFQLYDYVGTINIFSLTFDFMYYFQLLFMARTPCPDGAATAVLLIIMFANGILWIYKVHLGIFKKKNLFVVGVSQSHITEWHSLALIILATFYTSRLLNGVQKHY